MVRNKIKTKNKVARMTKIISLAMMTVLLSSLLVFFPDDQDLRFVRLDRVEGLEDPNQDLYTVTPQDVGRRLQMQQESIEDQGLEYQTYIVTNDNNDGSFGFRNNTAVLGEATDNLEEFENKTPRFSLNFLVPNKVRGSVRYDQLEPKDLVKDTLILKLIDNIPAAFTINFKNSIAGNPLEGLDEFGVEQFALSSWLYFPEGNQVLFPDGAGQVSIPFEIRVPDGAGPGDYMGMFLAALEVYGEDYIEKYIENDPDSFDEDAGSNLGVGAKIQLGIGLQVIVRLVGEVFPNLYYDDLTYDLNEDRGLVMTAHYENLGNATLRPYTEVFISDMFGRPVLNRNYGFDIISPGASDQSEIKVDINQFNPFAYGIHDIEVELFYDYYSFTESDSDTLSYTAGKAYLKLYSIPRLVIIIVLVLVVLLLVWLLYKNYRLFKLHKSSKLYIVKEEDDLRSIASKFKVDPKEIILVNHLKAPYFLDEGKEILIPRQIGKEK